MIEVRIPMTRMCLQLSEIEDDLMKAGVPPLGQRDGFVRSWQDVKTNEFVYQYTPREDALLKIVVPTDDTEGKQS